MKRINVNINIMPFLLLMTLLCAACSSDSELLQGNEYPLRIASATVSQDGAASRVAENADGTGSQWSDGDKIAVRIGDGKTGIYTLNADGSVKAADAPVYWQSRDIQNVTAWYPSSDATIDLSDQTAGLKYVLMSTAENKTYSDAVSLNFSHQLAKIRVKLSGDKASDVTAVAVKGLTAFNTEQGKVGESTNEGYIKMMKATYTDGEYYEANITPQTISVDDFIQITANDKTYICKMDCGVTTIEAGNVYTFNVKAIETTHVDSDTHTIYAAQAGEITADLVSAAMNGTGTLKVVGSINQKDLQAIVDNCCSNVTNLDLSEVSCNSLKIPDESFYSIWSRATSLVTILLPEGITEIGDYAFKDCTTLASANIPNSVKYIGQGAFQNSRITFAIVPKGVTSILKDTFSKCSSLSSIYLPASITYIDLFAFNECSNLTLISWEATTPPTCYTAGFSELNKDECVLKVPKGCVDAYKAADTWKNFKNIEEITE